MTAVEYSSVQPIVSATNLVKVYGEGDTLVRALDGVSASFASGTFTAIMGPSGSGKSTLMHCLAGLDESTSGHIAINGTAVESLNDNELTKLRRDQIGFIFQSFNLLPTHTAKENILLPLELAGTQADQNLLSHLVKSLGLEGRMGHLPSQLSGGEQQRVAVIRALISHPSVVFADEPTGALDTRNSKHLLSYLCSASQELGQTIIMVTHDPKAARYVDRAIILSDGQVRHDMDEPTEETVIEAMRHLGGE
ncbi:MAG: ABC transporter ATP-binding protein [Propionibacteriaceae bacterium]|jgi:putative ABC transport system ATP-binding protein|nr:ABC transporter ATP-binding protein [Propionibacteriaceae bacterium]